MFAAVQPSFPPLNLRTPRWTAFIDFKTRSCGIAQAYADRSAGREGCNDGAVPLDEHDLQTESFSNAKGWSAVRVTHVPSDLVAERHRSDALRSAVQAQRECIEELERRLAAATTVCEVEQPDSTPISRSEFESLERRVAAIEHLVQDIRRAR